MNVVPDLPVDVIRSLCSFVVVIIGAVGLWVYVGLVGVGLLGKLN